MQPSSRQSVDMCRSLLRALQKASKPLPGKQPLPWALPWEPTQPQALLRQHHGGYSLMGPVLFWLPAAAEGAPRPRAPLRAPGGGQRAEQPPPGHRPGFAKVLNFGCPWDHPSRVGAPALPLHRYFGWKPLEMGSPHPDPPAPALELPAPHRPPQANHELRRAI